MLLIRLFPLLFLCAWNIQSMHQYSLEQLPAEMIVLLAYAIVDTADIKENSHKELLTTLLNLSSTSKKIHTILFNLRCGRPDHPATKQFNDHLIKHIAKIFHGKQDPTLLAAAYVATPYALDTIVKKNLPQNITFNSDFKKKLGALPVHKTKKGVTCTFFQSLPHVLLEFPPATKQYISEYYKKN